ncbi:hypothetical protein C1Y11_22975 [Pseudomonas sp. FW305-20]|nr:hypothetical protein C1Y11_22975 [Pseudomonas sp. FW305-20]
MRAATVPAHKSRGERELWRGGLPPLGCEAAPKNRTAAQSNGGKPPPHKVWCAWGKLLMHCCYSNNSLRTDIQFLQQILAREFRHGPCNCPWQTQHFLLPPQGAVP